MGRIPRWLRLAVARGISEQGELFIFGSLCSLLFWYGRTHPRNLTQPGPHSSTHAGTGTGNFRVIPVRIQKHFSQKKKRNSCHQTKAMPFAAQVSQKSAETDILEIREEMDKTREILKDYPVRKADKRASCAIVIHSHTKDLQPIEKYSLDYSMAILGSRDYFFVLPESLDDSYYLANFKNASIVRFPDKYFTSREAYSDLCLSDFFYKRFASTHEFMLILQTDAIVLRDELDYWCSQPWDYIGAPWPTVMESRPGGNTIQYLLDRDCFLGSSQRCVTLPNNLFQKHQMHNIPCLV
jgi:hypothetical protein